MRVEKIRTLNSANIHTDAPVLVMTLNLEEMAGKETHEVTGFMDQLLTLLPGIKHHHCANRRTGDLVEPMRTTIGFGHITVRVALELATLAGAPVHYGNVLSLDGPERCRIVIEFKHEMGMRFLLHKAVELVDALIGGNKPPLEDWLGEARDLMRRTEMVA